jgi:hypothetical protein
MEEWMIVLSCIIQRRFIPFDSTLAFAWPMINGYVARIVCEYFEIIDCSFS